MEGGGVGPGDLPGVRLLSIFSFVGTVFCPVLLDGLWFCSTIDSGPDDAGGGCCCCCCCCGGGGGGG